MIFVLSAGHIKIEILNSFIEFYDASFEGYHFFFIKIVVCLEVSAQTGNNGIVLIYFYAHFFDCVFLVFEFIVEL